jgi:hypothetical protein
MYTRGGQFRRIGRRDKGEGLVWMQYLLQASVTSMNTKRRNEVFELIELTEGGDLYILYRGISQTSMPSSRPSALVI